MDRGAWQATVHGDTRVGHDLAAKPPYIIKLWNHCAVHWKQTHFKSTMLQ